MSTIEEKRDFPRVKTKLNVSISEKAFGNTINWSEGGLCVNSKEAISSPVTTLQVNFVDGFKIRAKAKLVWCRDIEEAHSLYGIEFIELAETSKSKLREELIKAQIQDLLDNIKIADIKKRISEFFFKDILNYIDGIIKINLDSPKQKFYSEELYTMLDRFNNEILLKGYCLDELLSDKSISKKVKENFRKLVGLWAYKSPIVKRAYEKPRGYPGDYKMLEIVYDNKPITKNKNVGLYFDSYFLKSPYATAVRIRKDRLREILLNFINKSKLNKIDILDIACGSCREIKELLPNLKTQNIITFNCLDWDEEALQFSQKVLTKDTFHKIKFTFIKEDVMSLIKEKKNNQINNQDLIYSIGLIDYLPDRVLKKLIYALFQLLKKGGQLILTHKNKEKTFPPLPPDWFCDWKFFARDKEEILKLFYNCGINNFELKTEVDNFDYIYYFTITKK